MRTNPNDALTGRDLGHLVLGIILGICVAFAFLIASLPSQVSQDRAQLVISQQLHSLDVVINSTSGRNPMTVYFENAGKPMLAICIQKSDAVSCDLYSLVTSQ